MGRFINADALVSTGQGMLGYNMFAYCLNNPVVNSDTHGLAARHMMASTYAGNALPMPIDVPEFAETPLTQTDGVINGQARLPYADYRIGLGSYGISGCAYIATYNAMQLIGKPQSLALVTMEVFAYGAVALGAGGAGPWGTAAYFNAHGIEYEGSFFANRLTSNISEGSVITFTAWYPGGWHAMTARYTNGEYWVYNRYNHDVQCTIYTSLSDAYSNGWWIYGFRLDP